MRKVTSSLQKLFNSVKTGIVLKPEYMGKGSWVGAPAACHSESDGCFYLLVRFRKEGPRGYKSALYRTDDGVNLEELVKLDADSLGARSVERGALRKVDKLWRFYLSYEDLKDGLWKLALAENENIRSISGDDFKIVLEGSDIGIEWVKDPVFFEGTLLVHTNEPSGKATYLVEKLNGRWEGTKVLHGEHRWDAYCPRITTVLKTTNGFFAFYDGASTIEENQEEKTGIAYGKSLKHLKSITPDAPALTSLEGSGSFRYLEVKELRDRFWIWYESSTKDLSHELRFLNVGKREFLNVLGEYLQKGEALCKNIERLS